MIEIPAVVLDKCVLTTCWREITLTGGGITLTGGGITLTLTLTSPGGIQLQLAQPKCTNLGPP